MRLVVQLVFGNIKKVKQNTENNETTTIQSSSTSVQKPTPRLWVGFVIDIDNDDDVHTTLSKQQSDSYNIPGKFIPSKSIWVIGLLLSLTSNESSCHPGISLKDIREHKKTVRVQLMNGLGWKRPKVCNCSWGVEINPEIIIRNCLL